MTANDPGHINNLDKTQNENLKKFWLNIFDKICYENKISFENLVDSIYGKELFLAFGYENPDVILLALLRTAKWNLNNAVNLLVDALKWKNEWDINQLIYHGESVLNIEEIKKGKTYYMGRDRDGRPISYCSAKDHIKGEFTSESTVKFFIFLIEIGRKLVKYPVESGTVVIDLDGFSMRNMDYHLVKFFVDLGQKYGPDFLGLALVINTPWIFNGCWFIIKRWLDPVILNKIHFIEKIDDLKKYIDEENLPKRFNGNLPDFNYIPPTEQDQIILSTIRQDYQGKTKATENHLQASKSYLRCTLEWAISNNNQHVLEQRNNSMKQLRDSYEQLAPYISTKTHYHRTGDIDEPIFDITYQNIQKTNQ